MSWTIKCQCGFRHNFQANNEHRAMTHLRKTGWVQGESDNPHSWFPGDSGWSCPNCPDAQRMLAEAGA